MIMISMRYILVNFISLYLISALSINLGFGFMMPKIVFSEETKIPTFRPQGIPKAGGITGRVSLDLRNMDIVDALKFLSLKAGLNIVPTKNVTGRVTLTVENAPIKDVFDIILRSNRLAYDKKGEIYNVMTEEEYRSLYGKNFSDTRQVKVFRLRYAIPEQAFNLLDAIKSDIGRLLVDVESGTVLLMDTPEKIKEAMEALEAMEQKSTVKIFNLKYAKAKDVEETLKSQLDMKNLGYIKADGRTNQVIVQTLPERMKNIERLIKGLDKKTKGVLIDTKILKIALTNDITGGIEWEGLFSVARQHGGLTYIGSYPFSVIQSSTEAAAGWTSRYDFLKNTMDGDVGAYPFSGTTSNFSASTKITPGERMHIGMVDGKRDFDILFRFLQTYGKTKIISNPTLMVIDNQEAKIHVGERRAYVTTTTTTGASTTTIAEEVTYVDIGVSLSVTPQINEDGYVTMTVKPEISSVIGNVETSEGNLIPIIDTSTAETTVIAKDGSTIIIGGLGREEKVVSEENFPYLSKIPLLGFLFSSKTHTLRRTELMILLTPIIVEGDRLITAKDRESELYDVKPFKKFDVFIEEPKRSFIEWKMPLKGFKIYGLKESRLLPARTLNKPVIIEGPQVGSISKTKIVLKSFKSYEHKSKEQKRATSKKLLVKEMAKQKDVSLELKNEAIKPKGFKQYD